MTKRCFQVATALLAVSAAGGTALADEPTVIANGFRQFVSTDKAYRVETTKIAEEPAWVAADLKFAFDCSRTNGWTIAKDGTVTRIPSLVDTGDPDGKYLTVGDASELVEDAHYYSTWGIYYNNSATIIKAGSLVHDETLKANCLSFGNPGDAKGMFFNPVSNDWSRTYGTTTYTGYRQNILTNFGTVVGVYRPNMPSDAGGDALKDGCGTILAGGYYSRFLGYGLDGEGRARNGVGLRFSLGLYNAQGPLKSGFVYTDFMKDANDKAKWRGSWQVLTAQPASATLRAYGIGMGNIDGADDSACKGGQSIAELMIFKRVLTEDEIRELVAYLNHKWLGRDEGGRNGDASIAWLSVGSTTVSPDTEPKTVTLEVPAAERLAVERLSGGRGGNGVLPTVEKTGAGPLTVGEAADFGGKLAVREGTLKLGTEKPVPTLEGLHPYMMLRLDPSDADSLTLDDDGLVSAWTNTAAYAVTVQNANQAQQTDAARRPALTPNALGEGLNVVDFGRFSSTGRYLRFDRTRYYQTVVAVVDTRMYGGGHFMSSMFLRYSSAGLYSYNSWYGGMARILHQNAVYASDFSGSLTPQEWGEAWVNGHRVDKNSAGNEVPGWQVIAWRVPCMGHDYCYLGASNNIDNKTPFPSSAGGMRMGEILGWSSALPEESIKDAMAYLMKKWLGRVPAGYQDDSGVPSVQNLVVGGDTATVDVPEGATVKVGTLSADGPAVKTGKGTLAVVAGGDLAGGLEVREGSLVAAAGADVTAKCEVAAGPALRLDASDETTLLFTQYGEGGTNLIWNWQDRSGRIAALHSNETGNKGGFPFWNTNETELCHGLPTVDFGRMHTDWNQGDKGEVRYLPLSRTLMNVRSVYLVYGSQAGGGQPIGQRIAENIEGIGFCNYEPYDFMRKDWMPDASTPLFFGACSNVKNGELWINGTKQSSVNAWVPSGGYDLVEVHTTGGCTVNALANGHNFYTYGGCRLGEVIIFERPLSEREKTATRNYLLKKWFAKSESELADLPAKPALSASFTGDLKYGDGSTWNVAVKTDGTTDDRISVTGTMSFETGATLNLTGLGALGDLFGRKVLIGTAGSFEGLGDVTIAGDAPFPEGGTPFLATSGSKLYVRFGRKGLTLLVR